MTRGLVGTAVFICALLLVSSAFAGSHRVHQRARLDHYARPTPNTSRMLNTRMKARVQQHKTYQRRMQRSRAYQPRAIQRLKQRARFVDGQSASPRVVRHARRVTGRHHVQGPKQLMKPPRLVNKIRCAGLDDQCLPQRATSSSASRATTTSSKRPKTLKVKLPAKIKRARDSVTRCPDGDCGL